MAYDVFQFDRGLVKAWTQGVQVEEAAKKQLENVANLPFVHKWVAAMPDVHWGMGATVGSVIPMKSAIVPAAVGVDIGCGMIAWRTSLTANDLPDDLGPMRSAIEAAVPHGRTHRGGPGDQGAWGVAPHSVIEAWSHDQNLSARYANLVERHPKLGRGNDVNHLGTLGTGNHFIEICLDLDDRVWMMLHSGSRGVGNRVGTYFIEKAREEMRRWFINLPDQDLAYLPEGTQHFDDYIEAVRWAQDYATVNRRLMAHSVLRAIQPFFPNYYTACVEAVNCHHNYVSKEHHFGADVWVTRKGAVSARKGEMGIIPGSMGARSFIVSGKGNPESFHSCSHGAGRAMSRTEAKKRFSVEDHVRATAGIECRKDAEVVDETPGAYKPIDAVMAAQSDLVEVIYELRQILCVKG